MWIACLVWRRAGCMNYGAGLYDFLFIQSSYHIALYATCVLLYFFHTFGHMRWKLYDKICLSENNLEQTLEALINTLVARVLVELYSVKSAVHSEVIYGGKLER
jgi:hypothetical protein